MTSPKHSRHNVFLKLLATTVALSTSACTILFGNVRPSAEKSDHYSVMDLSRRDADWAKLEPTEVGRESGEREPEKTEIADVTYQSKSTDSVISMNSTCHDPEIRQERETGLPALEEHSRTLLLGIAQKSAALRETFKLRDLDALQTTVTGRLDNRDVKVRSVVVKNDECLYDFLFLTRPENFDRYKDLFAEFTQSFSK